MTPTEELRKELRGLVDERIPEGGSDTDTRFLNTDLNEILTRFANINLAASEVWTRKSARAMSERGGLEKSSSGDESFTFVSLEKYRDHCDKQAALFKERGSQGSRLFSAATPHVAGILGDP